MNTHEHVQLTSKMTGSALRAPSSEAAAADAPPSTMAGSALRAPSSGDAATDAPPSAYLPRWLQGKGAQASACATLLIFCLLSSISFHKAPLICLWLGLDRNSKHVIGVRLGYGMKWKWAEGIDINRRHCLISH